MLRPDRGCLRPSAAAAFPRLAVPSACCTLAPSSRPAAREGPPLMRLKLVPGCRAPPGTASSRWERCAPRWVEGELSLHNTPAPRLAAQPLLAARAAARLGRCRSQPSCERCRGAQLLAEAAPVEAIHSACRVAPPPARGGAKTLISQMPLHPLYPLPGVHWQDRGLPRHPRPPRLAALQPVPRRPHLRR